MTTITARVDHVRGWWAAPLGAGRRWCADLDVLHPASGDHYQLQLTRDPKVTAGQWVRVTHDSWHSVIYEAAVAILPPAEAVALDPLTGRTRRQLFALMSQRGITDADAQRTAMTSVLGREVASRAHLTERDAHDLIHSLESE